MSQPIPNAATSNDIEGTRPPKRPRSSTTPNVSDLESCRRSLKYWFEDGNIVLRVGSVLFRVYRGILSRHSSVFRDMFAMPQPVTTNEDMVIEGCTVVELSGDTRQDWENLFKILYDVEVGYKDESQPNQRILVSMIRLGHKYQFEHFFNEAMSRIAAIFPKTLGEWIQVPDEVTKSRSGTLVFEFLFVLLEIGNQTLLPMVYFHCAGLFAIEEIFEVFRVQGRNNEIWSGELETILSGKARILSFLETQPLKWVGLHSKPQYRNRCLNIMSSGVSACHQTISNAFQEDFLSPYPVFLSATSVIDLVRDGTLDGRICIHCRGLLTTIHEEGRAAFWDNLPSYFGLPTWKDLKDV